ncbi:MAG: methylenetetrahydrofolate reductase, partial [Candidatus Aceula meridiana]|nr:methylenetetrahydrofolate reductase [Candidatus Aceula meridiana]
FSIGVAGFPEGHISCPDRELDAQYLKMKIDSGANYIITQLFFDNQDYFTYVKRLRNKGITNRVVPGIIPITDYHGILRFCKICGSTMPKSVSNLFAPIADDKEKILKQGIAFCVSQCRDLLEKGAPGIHFYSLNKIEPLKTILSQIKDLL